MRQLSIGPGCGLLGSYPMRPRGPAGDELLVGYPMWPGDPADAETECEFERARAHTRQIWGRLRHLARGRRGAHPARHPVVGRIENLFDFKVFHTICETTMKRRFEGDSSAGLGVTSVEDRIPANSKFSILGTGGSR